MDSGVTISQSAERARPSRTRRDLAILLLISAALLVPFLAKAFSLDDPLFIWAAEQIRAHPLDPYGFEVNWYGDVTRMHVTMQNPPAAAYVIALASTVLGRSEPALHAVFFAIAFLAIAGTYALARLLTPRPLLAATLTLIAPAFLVLAGTVMSDVLMLALWVWAVYFWLRAMKQDRTGDAWVAALLASVAMLSKYFAISLIPLFIADVLVRRPRRVKNLVPLAIPLIVLIAYHIATLHLYGHSLLIDAAGYARAHRRPAQWLSGLTLLGGSGASVLLYLLIARWRTIGWMFVGASFVAMGLLYAWNDKLPYPFLVDDVLDAPFLVQCALWLSAGCLLVGFVVRTAVRQRHDADAVLLGLWILGTAVFGVAINWTANSRSMLPLVPALSILASRVPIHWKAERHWVPAMALVPGAVLGFLCLFADSSAANAQRSLARQLDAKARAEQRELRFAGHWGFQYYLQELGDQPIDYSRMTLEPGALIALPRNNTNVAPLPERFARMEPGLEAPRLPFLVLMDSRLHAGFHSDVFGPLPLAFGRIPPAECFLQTTVVPIRDKSLVALYAESTAK